MDLNTFTIKSQEAIQRAQQIAAGHGQQSIETAHLLKGLLEVDEQVTPHLLGKMGTSPDRIASALDRIIDGYGKVEGAALHLSREANTVLQKSAAFAQDMKDEFVSLEHLLLALSDQGDQTARLLNDSGASEKRPQSKM